MNATKRKFNTLIQGIGARPPQVSDLDDGHTPIRASAEVAPSSPLNPLSASISTPARTSRPAPDTASPSAELLGKRRRVGVLEMASPSQKTGATTISNIVVRKWTSATTAPTTQKDRWTEPPKYCPSDRDELIKRLGTFQELTEWTPKPDKVNEIEWAKRGWICQGKERVRCTLCHKELVVKTNTRTTDSIQVPAVVGSDTEQGLVKRFSELIIEAHEEDCLWRRHGCDGGHLISSQPHTRRTRDTHAKY